MSESQNIVFPINRILFRTFCYAYITKINKTMSFCPYSTL